MHVKSVCALLAAAAMLAGCQTTGAGTQAAMMGANAATAPAYAPISASQANDGNKSCEQLLAEIGEMDGIVAEANQSQSNAQLTNAGIGIAQSLGLHMGGGGALSMIQAGGAAGQLTEQQRQQAQARAQQADVRRQVLTGIYQGKGC
ncbi:MAG: hypothetical protein KF769_15590 [Parvibaculum sp.]|uniref:hypothetical protein n=1 Tax=Parvibaculum sp. TaxID=2024848 RepID=UPI001DA573FB|nr:hypothetical protein [Parvibaculum sp.]MBX3489068.1 hypothetical protein [Parvibaculum sp.]MBX3497656.1 hypothetical protein [Parvibaculum sp.]MCW5727063.1 hypothetical protein [Parvibaculum sp.]